MNKIQPSKLPNPIKDQENWFNIGYQTDNEQEIYIDHEGFSRILSNITPLGKCISLILNMYSTQHASINGSWEATYTICQLIWNELERLENEKIHIKMEEMKTARYKKHYDALQVKWENYHTILQVLGLE